jgi:outer membrane receptor protein involved in Fe transport
VKTARRLLVCVAIVLSSFPAAFAQSAAVAGRVSDPDRAVVPGAEVTLTDIRSGDRQTTRSSADGSFRFGNLRPGRYLVEIAAAGFAKYSEDVEVSAAIRTIDAALQIAGLTEDVTVRGIATNPSIGRTAVPLRDQPITVNTVPAQLLESQGINDLVTALQFVSNVNAYQQYGVYEHYEFRGFADVVQMVDGIRNEGNRVRSQLSNVERIEVLKGPASVLYGSDSIGATMNIVLKQPSAAPGIRILDQRRQLEHLPRQLRGHRTTGDGPGALSARRGCRVGRQLPSRSLEPVQLHAVAPVPCRRVGSSGRTL